MFRRSQNTRFQWKPWFSLPCVIALVVFCGAAPRPASADELRPDPVLGKRLTEMFVAGFGRGTTALKSAQRQYESAKEQSPKDPRVDYAYGLVLLKQLKNKEALEHFQLATAVDGPEFWPAWQALAWSHFVAKDYPSGYSRLTEFAKRLSRSQADLVEREQEAEWIGQVLAALQKSVDTVKQREALLREDETLAEILGPDLNPAVARGKLSVHAMHALMEGDVHHAREIAQAKEEKEHAEREKQVAKDFEASTEKREALKKTAEDAKKYMDQQLAAFDKQLTRLERDYEFLQKRVMSITASQLQLGTEMSLLSQQSGALSNNNRGGNGQLAQVYQQRMSALEIQQIRYQLDMDQTLASTMAVSQRAQMVVGQRSAAVRQYERATGQIVQQDSAIDKWQDRLKKDGEKLKEQPKPKAGPVANKIHQARSFRTYVDLDLIQERDRLLDSLGIAMSEKPDAK
jgi:hypothetical protein